MLIYFGYPQKTRLPHTGIIVMLSVETLPTVAYSAPLLISVPGDLCAKQFVRFLFIPPRDQSLFPTPFVQRKVKQVELSEVYSSLYCDV